MPGASSPEAKARRALLDALQALGAHAEALVLVGAQAIYLHTGDAPVTLEPFTKDADLALNPAELGEHPLIEEAMTAAGFVLDPVARQPGTWLSPSGFPVDLMVPEALSGPEGRRGARIPPHGTMAARRAAGLEAAMVDRHPMRIAALDPGDNREYEISVAGPAALLVSKLHKIGERRDTPERLLDKDAHDIYRLLRAVSADEVAEDLRWLLENDVAGAITRQALAWLEDLAGDPTALMPVMAGRAEEFAGDPVEVAQSTWALVQDVLDGLDGLGPEREAERRSDGPQ